MTPLIRVAGAQLNLSVGDFEGNRDAILGAMSWADDASADVLLVPELAVSGYPPEDLVHRRSFVEAGLVTLDELATASTDLVTVVGFVDWAYGAPDADDAMERCIANAAAVLHRGGIEGIYHKVLLPNYGVFDEERYFVPGTMRDATWIVRSVPVGVSVCEDIWRDDGPPQDQAAAGAAVLLNINASPFHEDKGAERAALLADRASRAGVPVVYVNLVGGQDELVFDGDSMVFDADGRLRYRAAQFEEELFWVDVPVGDQATSEPDGRPWTSQPAVIVPRLDEEAEVYQALVCGLRNYVVKNGFEGVVVGLSGGIDSALTATIAVDALGPDAVWGVTMPTRYSSEGSVADSIDLAKRLGCRIDTIPIDGVFSAYLEALSVVFADTEVGVAEENLQARIRGAILMSISNKFGGMVVATGNKSEMAVGYATLYGDMAGGYSVLKDVFKTRVYRLARWRNRDSEVIPAAIIDKPPSAELRPDQLDTDTLPPYDELDAILRAYIEDELPPEAIDGHDAELVRRVVRMVDRNEYKRRQAAPGVKITTKAFGKDRRLPITNRFR